MPCIGFCILIQVYRVIWDCSPIRNLLDFGLLFLFEVMVEFGPMRLSVIRSSMSMWQLSIIMEFSISPRLIVVLLPMLVYGPM